MCNAKPCQCQATLCECPNCGCLHPPTKNAPVIIDLRQGSPLSEAAICAIESAEGEWAQSEAA